MNDNILTLIHFDICFFLKKLENQVSEKKLKFLLIRSDRELFDAARFEKYLTETSIQNTFILRDIVQKADRIIKINNEDFEELEIFARNNEVGGFSVPVGDGGFLTTSIPFECIAIENNQIHYAINSEAGEKYFFEQGNFEVLKSQDLAHKSARLINLITAAYPKLKQSNTNPSIDPLSVISTEVLDLYRTKVAKAMGTTGAWTSKIKCAAFCELLYENNYLGKKLNRVKQCNDFAKQWYPSIVIQLESSTKIERNKAKERLKNLF